MACLNENGKRPISATKPRPTEVPRTEPSWSQNSQSRNTPIENQSISKSSGSRGGFSVAQARINQIQEAEQMREWVSKEDDFMLQQTKKKARIRLKEGRAKTIDKLIVTFGAFESDDDMLEEGIEEIEEVARNQTEDPVAMIEVLDLQEIRDLSKEVAGFVFLEKIPRSRKLWKALQVLCDEQIRRAHGTSREGRPVAAISTEVETLLSPKSPTELAKLENQVKKKLSSDEPIDVEYWEQLLQNITVYKARAELKQLDHWLMAGRSARYRHQQRQEASASKSHVATLLAGIGESTSVQEISVSSIKKLISQREIFDPDAAPQLCQDDVGCETLGEDAFPNQNVIEKDDSMTTPRQIPEDKTMTATKPPQGKPSLTARFAAIPNEDFSQVTKSLYDREVARGIQENEEIFSSEESLNSTHKPQWASKYRPRKPRYFNRVQMGYEWNKYNQTHYDHDNPPPKVVQGYKFNVFYPDLIDKTKAPTYRIERENGRKRGQSFAPAGEEDTCLIRFVSGPPYEDLAFRIVDKEWDFSAKRERGFRSSFDKGILQLHFSFKKIYYRK